MDQPSFDQPLSETRLARAQQTDPGPSRRGGSAQEGQRIDTAALWPIGKLVIVSNRVAAADPDEPKAGGLAAALESVVNRLGAVWMGSSGNVGYGSEYTTVCEQRGRGQVMMLDLPATHYSGYYQHFANSILWPALHSLAERIIPCSEEHYDSYCQVNAFVAKALAGLGNRKAFWVHDYHFLPLGKELRKLGVNRATGFFLHTPWPTPDVIQQVPHYDALVDSMLWYDLVGFQTYRDLSNFLACAHAYCEIVESKNGVVRSNQGLTRCRKFPIGVDPKQLAADAVKSLAKYKTEISSVQEKLHGATLAIGVDRLDYTKGIDNRIKAFDLLLADDPHRVSLLQIATPSRTDVPMYEKYGAYIESLVDDINRDHRADDGWEPILYRKGNLPQAQLAGLYRAARVGVVTPLRDGMNLVAKEYVAAQDPNDPGVLVLSKRAGAAEDFDENEALLVDPTDPRAIAGAISRAVNMPREERLARWRSMMNKLLEYTIHDWSDAFIRELYKGQGARWRARLSRFAFSVCCGPNVALQRETRLSQSLAPPCRAPRVPPQSATEYRAEADL
ncbi:alpha,alpha-trehalose-phosphate synthase (UDP-forming) [Bradyrhizobium centrolobii]|uniref:alpha,alpha-trehalose-phosphate synthase (UDP-forming) n=1 Tax=Bradyrhizobium centrolobii TaxID=1505087 RepID=UPI0007C4A8ED|nr:trehalose-6-phosphate synthase [Bradyrhizobium centrolobii]